VSAVLGIDTGGTFTDFVLVDEARGAVTTAKVPSTPGDPAAVARLTAWLAERNLPLRDLRTGSRLEEIFLRLTSEEDPE